MKRRQCHTAFVMLLALIVAQSAHAATPPTLAFHKVWDRYDRVVMEG